MMGDEVLSMTSLVLILTIFTYVKEKDFLSEDAVKVSTDEEDATKCCIPFNPTAKHRQNNTRHQ